MSHYSSSSNLTKSNNYNFPQKLKMPLLSWDKPAQQQSVMTEKSVVEQHEKEASSQILSLHDKLCKEADKIREWKLNTESELKKKEEQIKDSTQTVQDLRKYILELKIQNENASLKMQEELSYREEIVTKIDSTRELCNVLKDHVQSLHKQAANCEATCKELQSQEKEHFENYQDISLKFQNLKISAIEEQNKLKSEIGKYSFEKEDIEKRFKESVQDAERQNMMYAENLSQKESQIQAFTEQLKDYEWQKAQGSEMIVHLNSNIQNLKEEIETKDSQIEHLIKEIDSLTMAKAQLSKEYEETRLHLSEIEEKYASLEDRMSKETDQHSSELEALQFEMKNIKEHVEQLKEVNETLITNDAQSMKLIEHLKSEKDILILEKANLDTTLKNEIHSKNELDINLEKKNDQIQKLNRCIIELNDELDLLKKKHSKTESEVKEINKLFTDLQMEFTKIKEEKETLQKELDKKHRETVHYEEKINIIEKREEFEIEKNNKDLAEIKYQNSQLTKNLSDIKIKMKLDEEKYQNDIKELEKRKQDADVTIDKFKHKQEQLQSQIKEFKGSIQKLEKELKQQKKENQILTIDKQTFEDMTKQKEKAEEEREQAMKDCEIQREEMMITLEKYKNENEKIIDQKEKEIETNHTKTLSDLKTKMKLDKEKYQNDIKKLEKCKKDANATIDKFKHDEKQLQSQMKAFEETIQKLEEELKQQKKENQTLQIDKQTFEDMTKQKEKAEKEKEQTMENCEIKRQEMMITLEKYKKENEKIIELKEKEIETIHTKTKLQTQQVEDKFTNYIKEKDEWKKEKQNLEKKISDLNTEISLLKGENKELQTKVEKAATNNNLTGEQLSNKTPIFVSRKATPKSSHSTPQISQSTPFFKSKFSRKRKVVFNPENVSFMSDTDSSTSEYGPINRNGIQSNNSPQPIACYGRVKTKTKQNVMKDVQEDIFASKNTRKVQKEIKKKDVTSSVLSKEIYEILPKKTKSGQTICKQNMRKTKNFLAEIVKSPIKVNKNNTKSEKENSFWFDDDPIFGFGMDD